MMENNDDTKAEKAAGRLLDTGCLVIGRYSALKIQALELAEQHRYSCLSWIRKIIYRITTEAAD